LIDLQRHLVLICRGEKIAANASLCGGLPWGDLKEKALQRFALQWGFVFNSLMPASCQRS